MLNYTFFSISKIEKKKVFVSKLKVERKFVWDDYAKLYPYPR